MVKKYIYMEAIRDWIFDPIVFDNHIEAKEFMVQKLASKLSPENSEKIKFAYNTGAVSSTSVLTGIRSIDMRSTYFDNDIAFCIIENTEDPNVYNHWFAKISEVEI